MLIRTIEIHPVLSIKRTLIIGMAIISSCTVQKGNIVRSIPYTDNYSKQQVVYSLHGGVASQNALASKVGIDILRKGGNAVDAAIAVQLALAVVYPEAGNLGGGGFMLVRFADGSAKALDFREKAPAAAFKNMYLNERGEVVQGKSLAGHLAAGVPGTVAGIFESLKYAKLPFKDLIQPAIDLAEKGYIVQSGIASNFCNDEEHLNTLPNVWTGKKYKDGDTLKQIDLANTLKRIRDYGRKDFYDGTTARLIREEMKRGGGLITKEDLHNYKAVWRAPQVFMYRGYKIISMPLPSSGGILLNQMLKMVEPYPLKMYGAGSVKALNVMIEATRRAYRDRAAYLGDGDFSNIPVKKLISDDYLKSRMKDFIEGVAGKSIPLDGELLKQESLETTHLTVVDNEGNAVAVTTTLNTACGCGVVVGRAGFLLNNEMNDFAIKPGNQSASGGYGGVANLIEPGKRMLSSMTPTIVEKDGKLVMALGTPGGTRIPTRVFQTIVNVIDFGMSGSDAVMKAPIFHHEWMPDEVLVTSTFPEDTAEALRRMGYKVQSGGGGTAIQLIKCGSYNKLLEIVSQGAAEGY